jgi:hypothetical protein
MAIGLSEPSNSRVWRGTAGRHRLAEQNPDLLDHLREVMALEIRGADDEAEPRGTSSEATVEREESAVE